MDGDGGAQGPIRPFGGAQEEKCVALEGERDEGDEVAHCGEYKVWLVLFRAMNIGGKNVIRMKELSAAFDARPMFNRAPVVTYIQTGNLILTSNAERDELQLEISDVLENLKLSCSFVVHPADLLTKVLRRSHFTLGEDSPSRYLVYFALGEVSKGGLEALSLQKGEDEQLHFDEELNLLFLFSPGGLRSSKVAGKIEKLLQCGLTARNWRTLLQLRALLERQCDSLLNMTASSM